VCLVGAAADVPAIRHHDGEPDGKKSLGGSGEIIAFSLPGESTRIVGVRIHGSRYGTPQPPKEEFLIYFLTADLSEVLRTEMAPYSLFERGAEKWIEVRFRKPLELPTEFQLAVDFRAGRAKGVYVSYDTSTGGKFSRVGLPGIEARETDFSGDWMIELIPAQ
jgi:RNA polymerase sigma-70 factor (ECF subfamily)